MKIVFNKVVRGRGFRDCADIETVQYIVIDTMRNPRQLNSVMMSVVDSKSLFLIFLTTHTLHSPYISPWVPDRQNEKREKSQDRRVACDLRVK